MKLTNLYNYGCSKILQIMDYHNLDSVPVVSNIESADDEFDQLFLPGIYDWAKNNAAYTRVVELIGLNDTSLETLESTATQTHVDSSRVTRISHSKEDTGKIKIAMKLDYILKRIDSYWPEEVDKSLALYNRLFLGQKFDKIALDIGVPTNKLKCLLSDFRRLWRLYKANLPSNNSRQKLASPHLAFIQQFLI